MLSQDEPLEGGRYQLTEKPNSSTCLPMVRATLPESRAALSSPDSFIALSTEKGILATPSSWQINKIRGFSGWRILNTE